MACAPGSPSRAFPTWGFRSIFPNSQPSEDRFSFVDNYSVTLRNHQLKFGAETNYLRDVENALFFAKGEYFYNTITDWALDLTPVPGEANAGNTGAGFCRVTGRC